jgi:competence protein ComEC
MCCLRSVAGVVLVLAAPWVSDVAARAERVTGPLKIYVFNVGQGDAILIVCPQDKHFLVIDAGARREAGSVKAFKAHVSAVLGSRRTIDVAVATHPHDDHVAAMSWLLDTFRVKRFIDSGKRYTSIYEVIETTARRQERAGTLSYFRATEAPASRVADFCTASNVSARVLVPQGFGAHRNPNNSSVVVLVTYNEQRFLFTGDAEEVEETQLLADRVTAPYLRDATVYKVGHHGSHTSSTPAFLAAVQPRLAAISSGCRGGTNDGYRHPRAATITALNGVVDPPTTGTTTVQAGLESDTDGRLGDGWTTIRAQDGIYVTAQAGTILIEANGTRRPTVTRPSSPEERAACAR